MSWRRAFNITQYGSLRGLARWLFLAVLVLAPWLYGGTKAWTIELINGALGVVLVLWIASHVVDRRWLGVPRALLLIAAVPLLLGWWMVLNANGTYDSVFHQFLSVAPLASALPGSADEILSFASMIRITLLIGVVLFVADASRRSTWLARLWYTIAIAGGAIALLGLLQKATHAPMIFWEEADPGAHFTSTFFASFYYHANAGAFLNLILPVTAGLLGWTTVRGAHPLVRGFYLATCLMVVVAMLSNTSRMAQVVGGLIAIALVIAIAKPAARMLAGIETRNRVIGLIVIVIALLAIAQAVRLDQPLRRWGEFSKQLPIDERWAANRTAMNAVTEGGVFGFGPGTFRAIFPHYQMVSHSPRGIWRFLHNDYLQTIVEWGWLGALSLGTLFFGGIGVAVRNYFRRQNWSTRHRILLPSILLALAGVAIHAVVDFPLQIYSLQLFVATYLGVCWGSGSWGEKSQLRPNNQ